jgi:hypothetical protein
VSSEQHGLSIVSLARAAQDFRREKGTRDRREHTVKVDSRASEPPAQPAPERGVREPLQLGLFGQEPRASG